MGMPSWKTHIWGYFPRWKLSLLLRFLYKSHRPKASGAASVLGNLANQYSRVLAAKPDEVTSAKVASDAKRDGIAIVCSKRHKTKRGGIQVTGIFKLGHTFAAIIKLLFQRGCKDGTEEALNLCSYCLAPLVRNID